MRSQSPRLKSRAVVTWWVLDGFSAALFAGALALSLQTLVTRNTYWSGVCALGMIAATLLRLLVQGAAERSGLWAADRTRKSIRSSLLPKLLSSRPARTALIGEDLVMAVENVGSLSGYYDRFQPLQRATILTPLIVAALVAVASPVSAIILLVTLVPFGLAMALAGGAAQRVADAQVSALSRLSGLFVDRIRSLPVILAFAAEDRVTRQVATAAGEVADRTYAVLRTAFLSSGAIEFFSAISVALVAVYCGFNLLGLLPFPVPERLDLGSAFFALAMAPEFYLPFRRLSAAYHEKQLGEAALAAINEREAGATNPCPRHTESRSATSLQVESVGIDYGDGRSVGPFDLSIRQGELIALTGPTGSGKTSLLHMLVGLVPLASGTVLADEIPIEPGAVNRQIGWTGQHVILLPGSIAENIALSDPSADRNAILDAAARAGLQPLLRSRPDGIDTVIDTRGSGLSGGERRRIGVARAILSDRPILLLDEPTADLDSETGLSIIRLLVEIARDRAVLVATHDPALIASATREVSIG